MKTIAELCKPRPTVFQDAARDDVLDITNLLDGTIDADKFFDENFQTQGMKLLLDKAFDRFEGKGETGVIKLTQAMGGGKTHNMLALALLARDPALRQKVLGKNSRPAVGAVKVIAFTGRESNAPLGIWGALADQLGKKDLFKDLYSPLQAPGQTSWVNLLKGQKVLILLDELPPYLDNARSISIGDSNLCNVTVTALSNLFSAMGKAELANVCLVFSDLRAAYKTGSDRLQRLFRDLESEANRMAVDIAPVSSTTDEVYDILRTRLFETAPDKASDEVRAVAEAYRAAVSDAVKAGHVSANKDNDAYPDAIYRGVVDSYPFHPAIKDLYARFKENQNFQQTRGLIRLMRRVVRQFFESGKANEESLVRVHDFDLNDPSLLSFMMEIKPSLDNAVAHDLAQNGAAVAEILDRESADPAAARASTLGRLLFVASLNDTPNAVNGLSERDAMGFLAAPGADLPEFAKTFEELRSRCWYLKQDAEGRYFFQNTENLVAKVNSLVGSYNDDLAFRELSKILEEAFNPAHRLCYEKVDVFPAVGDIKPERDRVTLVVSKPCATGLHQDLQNLFDNATFKNRLLFLTGPAGTTDRLLELAKQRLALSRVLENMRNAAVPQTDSQYQEASRQFARSEQRLLSAIRETFVKLYYPAKGNKLEEVDLKLELVNNRFDGENQIAKVLDDVKKREELTGDAGKLSILRQKCEKRLFTQPSMRWNDILERAATTTEWQFLHPSQMETLLKAALDSDAWRQEGGYLKKGPFPLDPTMVRIDQADYNETTGEFTLSVQPVNGDTVFWEVGADPSSASAKVSGQVLKTKDTEIRFVCEDQTGNPPHPRGDVVTFRCRVPLRHEFRQTGNGLSLELKTHPSFEIRFTTDGSNPKENGGVYTGEFPVPPNCLVVLAAVYNHGTLVEETRIAVDRDAGAAPAFVVDPAKPLSFEWNNAAFSANDTASVYADLQLLESFAGARLAGIRLAAMDNADMTRYADLTMEGVSCEASSVRTLLDAVRDGALPGADTNLRLEYKGVSFGSGADFLRFANTKRLDVDRLAASGRFEQ